MLQWKVGKKSMVDEKAKTMGGKITDLFTELAPRRVDVFYFVRTMNVWLCGIVYGITERDEGTGDTPEKALDRMLQLREERKKQ